MPTNRYDSDPPAKENAAEIKPSVIQFIKTFKEFSIKLRRNPDMTEGEMNALVNELYSENVGDQPAKESAVDYLSSFIDLYQQRRADLHSLRISYPNDQVLFKALFGVEIDEIVKAEISPVSIYFNLSSSKYKKLGISLGTTSLATSSGCTFRRPPNHDLDSDLAARLSYGIILIQGWHVTGTRMHEEQHALYHLLKLAQHSNSEKRNSTDSVEESFAEELTQLVSENQLISTDQVVMLIRRNLQKLVWNVDESLKDEIFAIFTDLDVNPVDQDEPVEQVVRVRLFHKSYNFRERIESEILPGLEFELREKLEAQSSLAELSEQERSTYLASMDALIEAVFSRSFSKIMMEDRKKDAIEIFQRFKLLLKEQNLGAFEAMLLLSAVPLRKWIQACAAMIEHPGVAWQKRSPDSQVTFYHHAEKLPLFSREVQADTYQEMQQVLHPGEKLVLWRPNHPSSLPRIKNAKDFELGNLEPGAVFYALPNGFPIN